MSETITLGGIELEAVQVLDLTQSAKVPEHPIEKQFSVSDHIIHDPQEFSITCILFKDSKEYNALRNIYKTKAPVRFESELDSLDDMVIFAFDLSPAGTNAYRAQIRIKQIRRAELERGIITFEDPGTGETVETGKGQGSDTAQTPAENPNTNKPTKDPNKSWFLSILDWLGGSGGIV